MTDHAAYLRNALRACELPIKVRAFDDDVYMVYLRGWALHLVRSGEPSDTTRIYTELRAKLLKQEEMKDAEL